MENKLNREPKSLTTLNIIIGLSVILILFLIEYQANGRILGPAFGGGDKAGLAVSITCSRSQCFGLFWNWFLCIKKL